MEVEIFHSFYGNLQYIKTIAGIEKMGFCQTMEKYYKKYFMPDFKDYSNLPQFGEDETPCPIKKVRLIFGFIHIYYMTRN